MNKILLVLLAGIFGASDAWANPLLKSTPQSIERGQSVYNTNCVSCHGGGLKGDGPAGKFVNAKNLTITDKTTYKIAQKAENKDKDMAEILFIGISEGVLGTSMASFKHIPEADRWAMVHYIVSKQE
jgi:mono/diheme cytochrome c family protein